MEELRLNLDNPELYDELVRSCAAQASPIVGEKPVELDGRAGLRVSLAMEPDPEDSGA